MREFKQLLGWGKKYKTVLFFVIVLTIVLQYLYSFIPLFLRFVFNKLENEPNDSLPNFLIDFFNSGQTVLRIVLNVCIAIIILQGIRLILRFFEGYSKGKLAENVARDMRVSLYEHINDLSYTYHNHADNGDLIQRCTSDVETSSGFLSNRIPEFINIIATVIIGAIQVGLINVTLMFVSMIMLPLNAIASIIFCRFVNKTFTSIEESESKMLTIVEENLAASRVVRAFAAEKYENEKFYNQNIDYSNKKSKFFKVMAMYWGISDFSCFLQYAVTISVGIVLAKEGIVNSGDILACLLLMGMLVWPIRGLGRLIGDFGQTLVAVKRIGEVLDQPSEFEESNGSFPEINGKIEFKNVSFKFNDSNKDFIRDVSFEINEFETIAIVGKTGSGKSTIVNILTRLLEYQTGDVLIDGVKIENINKKHLRKNIGTVLQDPFLFSKTIYENIAISNTNTPKERIYEAAGIAAIDKDIMNFEQGYSTIVGEKGATLSGGQKQRLAIARTLVSDKPIIIFDDSLSAVDTETDLMIRRALKQKNNKSTTIIITHRITTAKEADKIIVLNNGTVEAIGTHEQLSKKPGLYKKLWDIQGSLESEFDEMILGGESNGR